MPIDDEGLFYNRKVNMTQWHTECRIHLEKLGIKFVDRGETIVLRETKKPPVDFYPATGRWRDARNPKKTFNGGFFKFLNWYRRS